MRRYVRFAPMNEIHKFTRHFVIDDPSGFRAGTAAIFAKTAQLYDAKVLVSKNEGPIVDGKNMMELLMLGINYGDEMVVSADGADASYAMMDIERLLVDIAEVETGANLYRKPFRGYIASSSAAYSSMD